MLVAINQLAEALRAEANHEVLAVGDDRDAGAAGEGAPFAQQRHVAGDVELVVIATLFIEPSLGVFAVGSSGSSVDFDLGHGGPSCRRRVGGVEGAGGSVVTTVAAGIRIAP